MKKLIIILIFACSCSKYNKIEQLYCNTYYTNNFIRFQKPLIWSINQNGDTVIEMNNGIEYLGLRSIKFSNNSWIGTFDSNQYTPGRILNKSVNMKYTIKGEYMEGTANLLGINTKFRLKYGK